MSKFANYDNISFEADGPNLIEFSVGKLHHNRLHSGLKQERKIYVKNKIKYGIENKPIAIALVLSGWKNMNSIACSMQSSPQ